MGVQIAGGAMKTYRDLSDHAALLVNFVFPYAPFVPISNTTVPITFEAMSNHVSIPGARVSVNREEVTMPITLPLEKGLTHRIETLEVPTAAGERFKFYRWSNGAGLNWDLVNPQTAETYKAEFTKQFELNVTAKPAAGGTVTGSGWYNPGESADVTASANGGFRFVGFSGDLVETRSTVRVSMTGPKKVIANFTAIPVAITFQARGPMNTAGPTGANITVNGAPHTLPVTLQLDPTQTYRIEGFDVIGASERWLFQRWSNGSARILDLTPPISAQSFTVEYNHQFLLTTTPSPATGGSITGGGWYDHNASALIRATPNTGFNFSGYTGDYTGTAVAGLVPMTAARKVVGNFSAAGQPTLFASAGPRADGSQSGQRTVPITLRSASSFPALNARVVSITPITVVAGSGVVSVAPGPRFPVSLGSIPANGMATFTVTFDWPATASRVQMKVNFAADGGYTGSTTLNLTR